MHHSTQTLLKYSKEKDLIVGAIETSSVTIEWAMSEMLKNPRAMRKAQAEVRQFFGTKWYVEEASIQNLEYLKAVIKETLRLHTPLPLAVPREARESCEIEGFIIPKGTQVFLNSWAIHRDPKHWNEAERFQPERFVGSGIDYTSSHFEYKPFGTGKRICPGLVFALPNIDRRIWLLCQKEKGSPRDSYFLHSKNYFCFC